MSECSPTEQWEGARPWAYYAPGALRDAGDALAAQVATITRERDALKAARTEGFNKFVAVGEQRDAAIAERDRYEYLWQLEIERCSEAKAERDAALAERDAARRVYALATDEVSRLQARLERIARSHAPSWVRDIARGIV